MKKYYKIVKNINGKLFSAVIYNDYQIEYQQNVWIDKKPKTGGIFIFNDITSAKRFAEGFMSSTIRIYECKVRNPRKLKVRASHHYYTGYITDFWDMVFAFKEKRQKIDWWTVHKTTGYYTCPEGTYIANSIKLVKDVTSLL